MAIALSFGALLLGTAADRQRRRGIGPHVLLGVVATTFITAQLALILRWPVQSYLPWSIVAVAGAGTVLSYAILAEYFPKEIAGRANGALNVFHFGAAFAIQYATGVVLALWPSQDGHYPTIAYQIAFGLNLCPQAAALAWFAISRLRRYELTLVSAFRRRALVPVRTLPGFGTPRRQAVTIRVDWLNAAERQVSFWRLAALGSASLAALLGLTLAVSAVRANVTRHTVAMARLGQHLAVLPNTEATAPSDAQIAYVLARFIKNIRSVSIDPVVVRANWIDALNHVTGRGARTLNDYARDESPFTKIGRRTVTVEITEVVRASAATFDVRWEERIFEAGAVVKCERFKGVVAIVLNSPITAGMIIKNPLGLYVDRFTWWCDPIGDAAR
jgi:type IV secretory pathway TrbF-like protein